MRYDPWLELASRPDLTLAVTRLPRGRGWWLPERQAIVLDNRLGQVERRCVLAHELQHARAQDGPCGDNRGTVRVGLRQEQHAQREAALLLVDLDSLMDAVLWCHSLEETADELGVDRATLLARIDCLEPEDRDAISARLAAKGEVA